MAVQVLLSPPAGGKTQSVINQILAVISDQKLVASSNQKLVASSSQKLVASSSQRLAAVWVVLPDRLQVGYFKRRLAQAGGAMGVQVGTFGSLYQELLERSGRPVAMAPDPVAYRLVQAAIEDVFRDDQLVYYQKLHNLPGFALALRELFAEFKRALVDPSALLEETREREPALREVAQIYARYQARLQALNWADVEGISWLAVEALERDQTLAGDLQLLVVDGFDSFVASQLRALELLAGRAHAVTITLPGSFDMNRLAHRRFAPELDKLRARFQPEVRSIGVRPFLTEALADLEQTVFETGAEPLSDSGQIDLVEARSPSEEAREALRWLKARIFRDGLKAGDCALVVPNPDTYRPYLQMTAREFGLPLYFTLEETLIAAPPVAILLDLLELPLQKYPRRMLLDILRSPYFNLSRFDLVLAQAEALEIASLYGQVVEGLEQWIETLNELARADPEAQFDPEEEGSRPVLPVGPQALRLRESLEQFALRLAPPSERLSLPEWVRWLEELLDDLGFLQDPEIDRDRAARISLQETFRALGMTSVIAGGRTLDYRSFVSELQGAFQGARFGKLPDRVRSGYEILVLQMLEARGARFKAVAILGLSEGIYPQTERADPFFSEADRQRFGLEPRLDRQQAGVFYQALFRSDSFLLLTRPYLAADGEPWEPSPYWSEVRKLLPKAACQLIRPDDLRPLEEAGSPQELLFWAVQDAAFLKQASPAHYPSLDEGRQQLRHASRVLQARLEHLAAGPYEGEPAELKELLVERYGSQHIWSASRLETYGSCPFRFYVEVALDLQAKQPPEFGLDASQLGSLLHAILEQTYRQSSDPADPAAVLKKLPQVASRIFQEAPRAYGFRPSVLWEVQQGHWMAALQKTILENAAYDPAWRPVDYEARFGLEDRPVLEIQSETGQVRLRGVIDRIDRNAQGELRVVDYKTGGSHLAPADLVDGTRLQLPLYALAAERALNLGQTAEGLYWKILKAEPGTLKLASFGYDDIYSGVAGACALAEEHVNRFVAGIQAAAYPPDPPDGGCPSYCAAAAWCWRYSPSAY